MRGVRISLVVFLLVVAARNSHASEIPITGDTVGGAAIATSNARILVAWTAADEKLHIALTDFDGNIVVPDRAIDAGWGTPAAAFDGQRFLVVTPVLFSSMHGVFVDENGGASAPLQLGESMSAIPPLLAWSGSEYLALLQNGTVTRISPQGVVSTSAIDVNSVDDIAFANGGALVAWHDVTSSQMQIASAAFVSILRSGSVDPVMLASEPTSYPCDPVPCPGQPTGSVGPTLLACDSGRCIAAFSDSPSHDSTTVRIMQLNDDGSPLAAPVVLTESLTPTQIVADSGRFLLLLTGDDGIRASWIAPNLGYSPVFRIAADARSARAAALPDGRVAIAINRDAGTSLTFLTPPRARAVRR